MIRRDMYSVNITLVDGYTILIASGYPKLTKGPGDSIKFYDDNNFVLHLVKGPDRYAVMTPRKEK